MYLAYHFAKRFGRHLARHLAKHFSKCIRQHHKVPFSSGADTERRRYQATSLQCTHLRGIKLHLTPNVTRSATKCYRMCRRIREQALPRSGMHPRFDHSRTAECQGRWCEHPHLAFPQASLQKSDLWVLAPRTLAGNPAELGGMGAAASAAHRSSIRREPGSGLPNSSAGNKCIFQCPYIASPHPHWRIPTNCLLTASHGAGIHRHPLSSSPTARTGIRKCCMQCRHVRPR